MTVGDALTITARVDEFVPGGDAGPLSITQLSPTSIATASRGNALPAGLLIGADGLRPPTENLEDDGLTSFDPATDGLDLYESLEGILVTVDSPVAVAPTRAGSVWTVASSGGEFLATNISDGGNVVIEGGARLGRRQLGRGIPF